MTKPWFSVAFPFLLSVFSGCGTVDLGRAPEFVWWTDHESGDLSGWDGDQGGYRWSDQGGSVDIATTPTRSGRYSLRSSVVSPAPNTVSAGLVSRYGRLPTEAFYSAWFFVPEAVTLTDYWLFFKFRSRTNESDPATAVDLWDLDFLRDTATGMRYQLYHHDDGAKPELVAPVPSVPIGRWFQVEAFLRAATDKTGQLTVWIDGIKLYDVAGMQTVATPFIEWSVGAATEMKSLTDATLYVDDAAITTSRLGPDFPVFWRQ